MFLFHFNHLPCMLTTTVAVSLSGNIVGRKTKLLYVEPC